MNNFFKDFKGMNIDFKMLYWCFSVSLQASSLFYEYLLHCSSLRKLLVLTHSHLYPSPELKQKIIWEPTNHSGQVTMQYDGISSLLPLHLQMKRQSHPYLCSEIPAAVSPTPAPISRGWHRSFSPNLPSPLIAFLYPTPQIQQAISGHSQANMIKEASKLTTDLHCFLHLSKINLPDSVANFRMWPLLTLCHHSQVTQQIMEEYPEFLLSSDSPSPSSFPIFISAISQYLETHFI